MFPNGIPNLSMESIQLWLLTACLCTLVTGWTAWKPHWVPAEPLGPDSLLAKVSLSHVTCSY